MSQVVDRRSASGAGVRPSRCALALAVCAVLGGCGGRTHAPPTPPTPSPPPAPPAPEPPPQPFAAFAVYTSGETLLVPVGTDRPASRAHGFWVTTVEAPHLVTHYDLPEDAADVGLPDCPCATISDGCFNAAVVRRIDAGAGFAVSWDQPCSCYGRRDPERTNDTPEPAWPEYRVSDHGSNPLPCDIPAWPGEARSVVSGVLYLVSWGSSITDECGNDTGTNIYDTWGEEVALVEGPRAPLAPTAAWDLCRDEGFNLSQVFDAGTEEDAAGRHGPRPGADSGEGFWEADHPCDEAADLTYPVLRNGRLCWRGEGVDLVGREAHWAACEPLDEAGCPSPLDPCGDPAPFGDRLSDAEAWWVSPDGRFALSTAGTGFVVHEREAPGPAAVQAERAGSIGVQGVLFFPNAAFVAAAMAHDFTPAPAFPPGSGQACDRDDECPGGEVCDGIALLCVQRCDSDDDCAWLERCGARCHADGRCGPAPTGRCDETEFPCEPGFYCIEGVCASCRSDDDCATGRCREGRCVGECLGDVDCDGSPCVDERCLDAEAPRCEPGLTAQQFGERCWAELGAGRLEEAERLCRCGLTLQPSSRVRGALLYNLGRIAEQRGDVHSAAARYRESLEARGENAEVRRRLEALPRR